MQQKITQRDLQTSKAPFMKSNQAQMARGGLPAQKKMTKNLEQELLSMQERYLKLNTRGLKKNELLVLQDFLSSGQRVGSKAYGKLSLKLRRLILGLNVESSKIYLKHTKNPFKRLFVRIGLWSMRNLEKQNR